MQKKYVLIPSILLAAIVLIACAPASKAPSGNNPAATQKVKTESVAQEVLKRNDARWKNDKVSRPLKSKYQIITKTYIAFNDTMDIAIRYPQIVGLGDEERQNSLNELIRNDALPEQFRNYDDQRLFTLPIDYKITWQSDNLLSIQYSGVGYVKGTPHPNCEFYTSNIDIVHIRKVKLKDIVNIDESFAEKFRNDDIKTVSPHPGALSGRQIFIDASYYKTIDDTIRKFNDADDTDSKGRLQGYYCYFTLDSLGISVGAPHPIGDHAEFEIRYADIAENIKADNPVWKDFFPEAGK